MKYYAIIVAGGSGSRIKSVLPKQFLSLNGTPVLMHTLSAFHHCGLAPHLILVLNVAHHRIWKELCDKHLFNIPHLIVNGGEERFFSVQNGLKEVPNNAIVAIHDGARPLVSTQIITEAYQIATEKGNAIPAIKPSDSIRKIEDENNFIVNREEVRLIQTPQVFKSEIIKTAYEQKFDTKFTDDASVVENLGTKIHLIEGERQNIKITWTEDLIFAENILKQNNR